MLSGIKAKLGFKASCKHSGVPPEKACPLELGARVCIVGQGGPAREAQKGLAAVVVQRPELGREREETFSVELYAPAPGADEEDLINAFLVRQRVEGLRLAQLLPLKAAADPGLTIVGRPGSTMCSVPLDELHMRGLGANAIGCTARLGGLTSLRHDLNSLTCVVLGGPDSSGRYAAEFGQDGPVQRMPLLLVRPQCLTLRVRRSAVEQLLVEVPARKREMQQDSKWDGEIVEPSPRFNLEPLQRLGEDLAAFQARVFDAHASSASSTEKGTPQRRMPSTSTGDGFCAGAAVTICRLVNSPELNGRSGKLLQWLDDSERWAVDVDGMLGLKHLKEENLTLGYNMTYTAASFKDQKEGEVARIPPHGLRSAMVPEKPNSSGTAAQRLATSRERKFDALDADLARETWCHMTEEAHLPQLPRVQAGRVQTLGSPSADNTAQAARAKELGNAAFRSKNYEEAIEHYTEAVGHDPSDHIFFSNLSACHGALQQWQLALERARRCTELQPDWPKGYMRRGLAELQLGMHREAAETYRAGLALAPPGSPVAQALEEGLQLTQGAAWAS